MSEISDELIETMIDKCLAVMEHAYCPYSDFPVGCSLITTDNEIFTGCNVENAAFGMTICAERTAVVKAVSSGKQSFKAIFVCGKKKPFITPCGACRQFIYEFGDNTEIYFIEYDTRQYRKATINEILPLGFRFDD